MGLLTQRPVLRWSVPVTAAAVALGGGLALSASGASAGVELAPRTAAQLLVDLRTARLDGLSGTVVKRADLGLPALPGLSGSGGEGGAELPGLISGTHTLRVWYAGPDSARIALLGPLGESDIITDGREVWTWSSRTNTATHRTVTAKPAPTPGTAAPLDPRDLPATPEQAAQAVLAAIEPSTAVSTSSGVKVAGRDAYELILTPRDPATLVGQVRLAIDGEQHVPLSVKVFPKGVDTPAFDVSFTQISFDRPGPEQFRFTPPPGATVTEVRPDPDAVESDGPDRAGAAATVLGQGWTSVVVARIPTGMLGSGTRTDATAGPGRADQRDPEAGPTIPGILRALPRVSGPWGGGHLLTGRLFSVLLTDDGRLLAGAVGGERLTETAADPAAVLKAGP